MFTSCTLVLESIYIPLLLILRAIYRQWNVPENVLLPVIYGAMIGSWENA